MSYVRLWLYTGEQICIAEARQSKTCFRVCIVQLARILLCTWVGVLPLVWRCASILRYSTSVVMKGAVQPVGMTVHCSVLVFRDDNELRSIPRSVLCLLQ